MIITITGKPCCGKSTMAEIFIKKYGFERIYAGAIFKSKAKEMGLNILELCSSKEIEKIDIEVDDYLKNVYKARLNDNLLIESRTSWSFMPKAFNVFIDIDDDTMAMRYFNSDRSGKEKPTTIEDAKISAKQRYITDCKRYKKLYKIDCSNLSNYTFVLDNSKLTPEETADTIYKEYVKFCSNSKK